MGIEHERHFQNVVSAYEHKLNDLQSKREQVKELDARIENIGFFKRIPVTSQKKMLLKEIRVLTDELDAERFHYDAAVNALKNLKDLRS